MDAAIIQTLANALVYIFNALSLAFQQILSSTLGLNLPLTIVALIVLGLAVYAMSRSSIFSLVAAGFLFIVLVI